MRQPHRLGSLLGSVHSCTAVCVRFIIRNCNAGSRTATLSCACLPPAVCCPAIKHPQAASRRCCFTARQLCSRPGWCGIRPQSWRTRQRQQLQPQQHLRLSSPYYPVNDPGPWGSNCSADACHKHAQRRWGFQQPEHICGDAAVGRPQQQQQAFTRGAGGA